MSAILLESNMLHYEVLGRGRPIIFLHSWVGSWRYWIPVMQSASMTFRAYALDLWGFGDTAKNPERYSVAQQVNLVRSFLDEMGILKVALVGHGLGAIVSLLFAAQYPEDVDRVLAIGYPLDESMANNRLRTSPPLELADWMLGNNPASEPVRTEAPKTDPRAIVASFATLGGTSFADLWRRTSTACLMVNGTADVAVQPPRLEQQADMPEQMHAVLFEESGHFPMLDEGSKFNRLLGDFFALPSGETPRQLQLKEEWKRRVR
jgi:pimeloyl-ACP methyl ester carboxylesterase